MAFSSYEIDYLLNLYTSRLHNSRSALQYGLIAELPSFAIRAKRARIHPFFGSFEVPLTFRFGRGAPIAPSSAVYGRTCAGVTCGPEVAPSRIDAAFQPPLESEPETKDKNNDHRFSPALRSPRPSPGGGGLSPSPAFRKKSRRPPRRLGCRRQKKPRTGGQLDGYPRHRCCVRLAPRESHGNS